MMRLMLIVLGLMLATPALALEPPTGHGGEVRVPLADYERMLALLNAKPRPAPAAYAIGSSNVAVEVTETEERTSASVAVTFRVETFEDLDVLARHRVGEVEAVLEKARPCPGHMVILLTEPPPTPHREPLKVGISVRGGDGCLEAAARGDRGDVLGGHIELWRGAVAPCHLG